MRAAWLETIGSRLRIEEHDNPTVRDDGVIVSVRAVRVPSYARQVFDGTLGYDLPTPLIPGPACIGQIETVGSGVFDLQPGQFVLCNSLLSSADLVGSADEILIGWTGARTDRSRQMQNTWRHGSFAEKALYPARCLTPLPGAELFEISRLPFLASLAIAAGGLKRGGATAGETVIVNGATGQLGSSAILVALASGAGHIIAVGRDQGKLDEIARLSPRIATFLSSTDSVSDTAKLLELCDGGADLAVDYLADTPSATPTQVAIDALKVGGTAVLIGGVKRNLTLSYSSIMRRRITIRGSFMFDRETASECWRLVESRAIDLSALSVTTFRLDDIEQAMDAAVNMSGFELAVVLPNS